MLRFKESNVSSLFDILSFTSFATFDSIPSVFFWGVCENKLTIEPNDWDALNSCRL